MNMIYDQQCFTDTEKNLENNGTEEIDSINPSQKLSCTAAISEWVI